MQTVPGKCQSPQGSNLNWHCYCSSLSSDKKQTNMLEKRPAGFTALWLCHFFSPCPKIICINVTIIVNCFLLSCNNGLKCHNRMIYEYRNKATWVGSCSVSFMSIYPDTCSLQNANGEHVRAGVLGGQWSELSWAVWINGSKLNNLLLVNEMLLVNACRNYFCTIQISQLNQCMQSENMVQTISIS